jgi:hypothetical protein
MGVRRLFITVLGAESLTAGRMYVDCASTSKNKVLRSWQISPKKPLDYCGNGSVRKLPRSALTRLGDSYTGCVAPRSELVQRPEAEPGNPCQVLGQLAICRGQCLSRGSPRGEEAGLVRIDRSL